MSLPLLSQYKLVVFVNGMPFNRQQSIQSDDLSDLCYFSTVLGHAVAYTYGKLNNYYQWTLFVGVSLPALCVGECHSCCFFFILHGNHPLDPLLCQNGLYFADVSNCFNLFHLFLTLFRIFFSFDTHFDIGHINTNKTVGMLFSSVSFPFPTHFKIPHF